MITSTFFAASTNLLSGGFLSPGILMLLIIVMIPVALYAQFRVSSTYKRNSEILSRGGITGREAAQAVMEHAGITDIEITEIEGHLTDHYDPLNKRLALSSENYRGTSLAALGVAAHEAGHAIQHKVGYSMLHFRMALVPATNFVSRVVPILFLAGFFARPRPDRHVPRRGHHLLRCHHAVSTGDAARRIRRYPAGEGSARRARHPGPRRNARRASTRRWTPLALTVPGSLCQLGCCTPCSTCCPRGGTDETQKALNMRSGGPRDAARPFDYCFPHSDRSKCGSVKLQVVRGAAGQSGSVSAGLFLFRNGPSSVRITPFCFAYSSQCASNSAYLAGFFRERSSVSPGSERRV